MAKYYHSLNQDVCKQWQTTTGDEVKTNKFRHTGTIHICKEIWQTDFAPLLVLTKHLQNISEKKVNYTNRAELAEKPLCLGVSDKKLQ